MADDRTSTTVNPKHVWALRLYFLLGVGGSVASFSPYSNEADLGYIALSVILGLFLLSLATCQLSIMSCQREKNPYRMEVFGLLAGTMLLTLGLSLGEIALVSVALAMFGWGYVSMNQYLEATEPSDRQRWLWHGLPLLLTMGYGLSAVWLGTSWLILAAALVGLVLADFGIRYRCQKLDATAYRQLDDGGDERTGSKSGTSYDGIHQHDVNAEAEPEGPPPLEHPMDDDLRARCEAFLQQLKARVDPMRRDLQLNPDGLRRRVLYLRDARDQRNLWGRRVHVSRGMKVTEFIRPSCEANTRVDRYSYLLGMDCREHAWLDGPEMNAFMRDAGFKARLHKEIKHLRKLLSSEFYARLTEDAQIRVGEEDEKSLGTFLVEDSGRRNWTILNLEQERSWLILLIEELEFEVTAAEQFQDLTWRTWSREFHLRGEADYREHIEGWAEHHRQMAEDMAAFTARVARRYEEHRAELARIREEGRAERREDMAKLQADICGRLDGTATGLAKLEQSVDGLQEEMTAFGQSIDRVDQRLGGLGQSVDGLGQSVDGLGQSVDKLGQSVDGLEQSIDRVDQRLGGLDQKFGEMSDQFDVFQEINLRLLRLVYDQAVVRAKEQGLPEPEMPEQLAAALCDSPPGTGSSGPMFGGGLPSIEEDARDSSSAAADAVQGGGGTGSAQPPNPQQAGQEVGGSLS